MCPHFVEFTVKEDANIVLDNILGNFVEDYVVVLGIGHLLEAKTDVQLGSTGDKTLMKAPSSSFILDNRRSISRMSPSCSHSSKASMTTTR